MCRNLRTKTLNFFSEMKFWRASKQFRGKKKKASEFAGVEAGVYISLNLETATIVTGWTN